MYFWFIILYLKYKVIRIKRNPNNTDFYDVDPLS